MMKIENLISLGAIDAQIQEIESSKGDLPARIEKLESEKIDSIQKIENLNTEIAELNKKKNNLNRDKEDFNTSLEKFKEQIFLVKNNKEYDALNTEIDTAKDNLLQVTNQISSIASNQSEMEEEIKLKNSDLEDSNRKIEKYNLALKDAFSDNKKEYETLKKQRTNLISGLDQSILKNYNKMLNAKGCGLASARGGACASCYTVLPTQLVTEIKQRLEFKYCPSCNILLYFEE